MVYLINKAWLLNMWLVHNAALGSNVFSIKVQHGGHFKKREGKNVYVGGRWIILSIMI